MIRLNSVSVHYMDLEKLQEFSNLTLISLPDGELIQINPMTLAAFGSSVVCSDVIKIIENQQNLDDELILITEFNKAELEMVVKFCMEGILPLPMSKLEKHVPVHISRLLILKNFERYLQTKHITFS